MNSIQFNTNNPMGYPSYFTDPRDNQQYRVTRLRDGNIWYAQNANFDTKVYCSYYDGNPSYAPKYGRMYDWTRALDVCPDGWRLPSKEEWKTLAALYDISIFRRTAFRAFINGGISDLNVQLGGVAHYHQDRDKLYGGINKLGYYWTANIAAGKSAYAAIFTYKEPYPDFTFHDIHVLKRCSCRCIKEDAQDLNILQHWQQLKLLQHDDFEYRKQIMHLKN